MTKHTINIEEEYEEAPKEGKTWTEEVSVAGDQVLGKVQELLREAAVRKITVLDESGKKLISIPMYAGAAGILVLGPWSVLALVGAWVAKFSILIEREGEEEVAASAKEEAADAEAEAEA